jgi:predicted Zn-dependent protease
VHLSPDSRDAWVDYAETLLEARRPHDALEAFRRAASLEPGNAGTYFQQAKALFALGRREESVRSLKTAFLLDPSKRDEFAHAYPEMYGDVRIRRLLDIDG